MKKLIASVCGFVLTLTMSIAYSQTHGASEHNSSVEGDGLLVEGQGAAKNYNRLMLVRDEAGRITQVTSPSGDVVLYKYDVTGKPTLESTIIGAQFRNSTDSALYLAKKRHDQDRYNQLVLKNTLTIANGKHSSLATVPQTGDLAGGGSCDAGYHPESCDPLTDDFWVGCAADLTCFGMMDDINSFVGQLANYLAVGAALGGTIFGTLSVLSADAAAVVLVEIGLGTALGGGIVIAFAGGYIVGTGIYYVGTWVYVNGGSLMYSGR